MVNRRKRRVGVSCAGLLAAIAAGGALGGALSSGASGATVPGISVTNGSYVRLAGTQLLCHAISGTVNCFRTTNAGKQSLPGGHEFTLGSDGRVFVFRRIGGKPVFVYARVPAKLSASPNPATTEQPQLHTIKPDSVFRVAKTRILCIVAQNSSLGRYFSCGIGQADFVPGTNAFAIGERGRFVVVSIGVDGKGTPRLDNARAERIPVDGIRRVPPAANVLVSTGGGGWIACGGVVFKDSRAITCGYHPTPGMQLGYGFGFGEDGFVAVTRVHPNGPSEPVFGLEGSGSYTVGRSEAANYEGDVLPLAAGDTFGLANTPIACRVGSEAGTATVLCGIRAERTGAGPWAADSHGVMIRGDGGVVVVHFDARGSAKTLYTSPPA